MDGWMDVWLEPSNWWPISCFYIIISLPQVDVASLITQKLLKVSMKHIEIISKARQKGIDSLILFF